MPGWCHRILGSAGHVDPATSHHLERDLKRVRPGPAPSAYGGRPRGASIRRRLGTSGSVVAFARVYQRSLLLPGTRRAIGSQGSALAASAWFAVDHGKTTRSGGPFPARG